MESNMPPQQTQPMPQQTPTPKPTSKNLIPTILSVIILLLIGSSLYLGYENMQLKKQIAILSTLKPTSVVTPTPTSLLQPTRTPSGWTNENIVMGKTSTIGFIRPATWFINGSVLSQIKTPPYRADVGYDSTVKHNFIEFRVFATQVWQGITNIEWFAKLNEAKIGESIEVGKATGSKITTGVTVDGDTYVVYKTSPQSGSQGENFDHFEVYFIHQNILYEVILDDYNQEGLQVFNKLIPSISIKQ